QPEERPVAAQIVAVLDGLLPPRPSAGEPAASAPIRRAIALTIGATRQDPPWEASPPRASRPADAPVAPERDESASVSSDRPGAGARRSATCSRPSSPRRCPATTPRRSP